ncbi:MAG: hypothetical protein JNM43_14180 [Planctomycetaceae bacterium]|nr:hypothetical protein [Planctomycetaceae bacterium]
MIPFKNTLRSLAALCVALSAGLAVADEGVVRMSDRAPAAAQASADANEGVVRMSGSRGIQKASFECGEQACAPQCAPQCGPVCQPMMCQPGCMPCDPCQQGGCNNGCWNGTCYTPMDCNSCFSTCDANGMPMAWCQNCHSSPCQCNGGDVTIFAHSCDSGTGSACRDFWRGHSMSFRNKNARLADCLFGWMIPSGCCGQGCPPVGKYQIVYADQPGYINPQDTQMYGAQGYGMPMTVPVAPNVNYTYNYSAGIPSSRVTHIGNYNPQTSPQPLYHRTW